MHLIVKSSLGGLVGCLVGYLLRPIYEGQQLPLHVLFKILFSDRARVSGWFGPEMVTATNLSFTYMALGAVVGAGLVYYVSRKASAQGGENVAETH